MKVKVLIVGREEYKDNYPSSLSLWKGDRTFTHTNKKNLSALDASAERKQEQGVSVDPNFAKHGSKFSHRS